MLTIQQGLINCRVKEILLLEKDLTDKIIVVSSCEKQSENLEFLVSVSLW